MTRINAPVEVTALGFRNKKDQHQLESFPKRMVWGDREYNFAEMTMQYLVRKGQQLVTLFDVTDGSTLYRLRLEDDCWTLVGTSGSGLIITRA
ncbi:MAG: hypothetical protein QFB87_04880 [Patescibacteria group bacterium]|nr:hypothetical protein [Patescibacteria group bacterium]